MSSTHDFTRNSSTEDLLQRMSDELGTRQLMDDPSTIIAGILWLDHAKRIAKGSDYILITPSVAMWLLMDVEILNEEIAALRTSSQSDENAAAADEEWSRFEALVTKPFEIRLPDNPGIPMNVRGQAVRIALMTDEEAMDPQLDYVMAISLREDGTAVESHQPYRRQVV